jgi:hypothetical protein
MPRPDRKTITGRSSVGELSRADKDRFIRQLYAQLGPAEFWRRRLAWSARASTCRYCRNSTRSLPGYRGDNLWKNRTRTLLPFHSH